MMMIPCKMSCPKASNPTAKPQRPTSHHALCIPRPIALCNEPSCAMHPTSHRPMHQYHLNPHRAYLDYDDGLQLSGCPDASLPSRASPCPPLSYLRHFFYNTAAKASPPPHTIPRPPLPIAYPWALIQV